MNSSEVFSVIANRIVDRCDDLALIVQTGYSFEEWSTWEAFLACKLAGWVTLPRPRYISLGVADCKDFADLVVGDENRSASVVIEFATVHGSTSKKWVAKIDGDTRKLASVAVDGTESLQILILGSVKMQIDTGAWWK